MFPAISHGSLSCNAFSSNGDCAIIPRQTAPLNYMMRRTGCASS